MRTTIENKTGLDKSFTLKNIVFNNQDKGRQPRSCFYDFAVERGADFLGYAKEENSAVLDSLDAWFE